jgi:hypothetical protein
LEASPNANYEFSYSDNISPQFVPFTGMAMDVMDLFDESSTGSALLSIFPPQFCEFLQR